MVAVVLTKPYEPQPVENLELAFPAHVLHLMPAFDDIPDDFRHNRGEARQWVQFQRDWFYKGLPAGSTFVAVDGIDAAVAARHLKTIQGSFEPSHEHKEAAVAYLASLWLVSPPGGAS